MDSELKLNRYSAALLILAVFLVQLFLISYNQFTGFVINRDPLSFIIRLMSGTIISSVFAVLLFILNLKIIEFLDLRLPWNREIILRLFTEFVLLVICGALMGVLLTLSANLIFTYKEPLTKVLIINAIISVTVNIPFVVILESIQIFRRSVKSELQVERLKKENTEIRFDVLKSQLNPHFLFNSLNVLSGLINSDTARAQKFIEEFSSVYRYILDVIDRDVVPLRDEIGFAGSYAYLQKLRFGDNLKFVFDVEQSAMNNYIPPLAVQTLIENALKHNVIDGTEDFTIVISADEHTLRFSNPLRLKKQEVRSTGIGLTNLFKRYTYLSDRRPLYKTTFDTYIAELPLIKGD